MPTPKQATTISPNQRVLVASQYGPGGSSTRVRLYDWLDHLGLVEAERFEYRGASSNAPTTLLKDLANTLRAESMRRQLVHRAAGAHVVLSRELSPLSQGDNEVKLLQRAQRGIYDFDDALYAKFPGVIGTFYSRQRVWKRSVAAADTVIAGSELLAEHALRHNRNVVMIPSCVDPTHYGVRTDFEFTKPPTAVWIGSPATEPYLRIAQQGLLQAHAETGLRLRVISAGTQSLGPLDPIVERVSWRPDTFASHLATADFGIMPLPDDEWSRGKCAYKLLQYGAAGIPVVGSPVGANHRALQRLGGFAPISDAQWGDMLIDLVRSSTSERARLGNTSREGVVGFYSYQAWAQVWRATVLE